MVEKPKLKRDWVGRYVRLRITLETRGGIIFDKGEVMKVCKYYRGLGLRSLYCCEHCRRKTRQDITGIPIHEVEILAKDFKPEIK